MYWYDCILCDQQGKGANTQDQAAMIRKQKEELDRLKRENPVNRNPGSATFTSFSSPAAQS